MSGQQARQRHVYNLGFPAYCREFSVAGYRFEKTTDYADQLKSLHHVRAHMGEHAVTLTLGTHACTASVVLPEQEETPVIPWENEQAPPSALNDILLLLCLFTGRDVFSTPKLLGGEVTTWRDPRCYSRYWHGLRSELPYKKGTTSDGEEYDAGFADGINQVYRLMRTADWRRTYENGRFLPLFRAACQKTLTEVSFAVCWTIWGHLFSLHNREWLSDEAMRKLPVAEKVAFIITRYGIKDNLDKTEREGVKRFAVIRHGFVHVGQISGKDALDDADLFIRVTVKIVAMILGLEPSDVTGSQWHFAQSLARGSNPVQRSGKLKSAHSPRASDGRSRPYE